MFRVNRMRYGSANPEGPDSSDLGSYRQAELALPGGATNSYNLFSPVTERLEKGSIVHDWIPKDTRTLNRLFRMIYITDPDIGSAIDFYREIPFGPIILGDIKDKKVLQIYQDCLDAIQIERHLPYLGGDILVIGRLILHMILDESKGYFTDIIAHDSDHVKVQVSPILGQEPIMDLQPPPEYRRWATSRDPRVKEQRDTLSPKLLKLMAAGRPIPLNPDNTVFVPRRIITADALGTSIIMRAIVPIAVEFGYLNAEAAGLRRRAGPRTIIKMGIENVWEPTGDEMAAVQDMFIESEQDPVGAFLVLRNGIEVDQSGGHSEIAKWSEQRETFKNAKLQALGMNDQFATGEANWNYLESMLSLSMERIRNFRNFCAVNIIQDGILAPIAELNEFYKRSEAELSHRIRIGGTRRDNIEMLQLPSLEWAKSLQPTADRDYLDILQQISDKGVPVPIRKWAQAAGYDIDEALGNLDADLDLRKQLGSYKDAVAKLTPKPPEDDFGGGGDKPKEGNFREARAALKESLRHLPLWENHRFLDLSKKDVGTLLKLVPQFEGKTPTLREWNRCRESMLRAGVDHRKVQAFEYVIARSGVVDLPLNGDTISYVRDGLLSGTTKLDRRILTEVAFLNAASEPRAKEQGAQVEAPPWTGKNGQLGPKLLTGEAWEG